MHHPASALRIAFAGMLSLAVAMGIGRFAFTPLLPLMLAEGAVDLAGASWLASANYLGYLVGALLCTFQPWIWRRVRWLPPLRSAAVLRAGLAATGLLTAAMAWPLPALWPALRFAAGVASAFVFVFTSGWCLMQLAHRHAPALGGLMYAGPGGGIVVSGLAAGAMVQWGQSAAAGWTGFGLLAAVLSALVWPVFGEAPAEPAGRGSAPAAGPARAPEPGAGWPELALLTLAYGLAGFGYIISATFLPVIARQAMPGSPWLDLFWPIFGGGVVAGALLATRLTLQGDLRLLLAACYAVQALGIVVGLHWPTVAGFALGSALLGLPFTTITFFAMQEARRLRPAAGHSFMGLLTVLYGIGQIAGPLVAAAILARSATPRQGFDASLEVAAAVLVAGALLYVVLARRWPMAVSPRGAPAAGPGRD
ncbi:YbfB/YjiJ family MFS transporter [Ramlibacter sp.]|uniref:YbfB/YjiJ family MFS transporter n=1 Tax=Ramlibacter sp. TaxID=1917967 RepID=UPI002C891B4A|nr:YbfB/YjiJ family MFS transporter [Ramlibacter sp.]HWI81289.1 YbfB/YjiJ family MFS transporter [Ramlibacter sp.]